ncbi:gliding motility-associated C-terminal domain-containing protein [Sediminibacterium soli]|uniref:gliding motility-associated C-terminal domain-containing protein n=1 Tax=Sediminibacterium soli TaxID=2698829 RepID=UPI00137A51F9|nr:gliding motility-associated C-terminal domain-containing protein [Sediminibacterium soli]NCI46189.1 gliding motility-associated C-terminal domain-containing protein [Sediminibacterium soli]
MTRILLIGIVCFAALRMPAQCPANLGFETGDFTNWKCYSGRINSALVYTGTGIDTPLRSRHTIFTRSATALKDPYGGFPVVCPNGSNHSIRLGNDSIGGQVDGVSYTFTVPSDKDVFSIIYNYAVVLQNPSHFPEQQPRFTAKVLDETTGQYLNCSSFDFSASSSLPGFKQSGIGARGADVYYKPWSPVTIKLVGYAGKKLTIEFRAQDCTQGGHFGYAYLDINEDCTAPISGNIVCEGAQSTVLIAPFGFREYRWYTTDFSRQLGTGNTLRLQPVPPVNTAFAVEVLPYPGSGCVDTLYTTLQKASAPFSFLLQDTAGACLPQRIDLTAPALTKGSTRGLAYTYFLDSFFNYMEQPESVDESGTYYIKASNAVGCIDLKPIVVVYDTVPRLKMTDPPPYTYPNTGNLTDAGLYDGALTGLTRSYWRDAARSIPVSNPLKIEESGRYYVYATTRYGCAVMNSVQLLLQIAPPPNAFSPNSDGINDTWRIAGIQGFPQAVIDVFDRYGRSVFHSVGYDKVWDGTLKGKPLAIGTYYYVIWLSDKLKRVTGSVTILR